MHANLFSIINSEGFVSNQGVGASSEELNNIEKSLSELRCELHSEYATEDLLLVSNPCCTPIEC